MIRERLTHKRRLYMLISSAFILLSAIFYLQFEQLIRNDLRRAWFVKGKFGAWWVENRWKNRHWAVKYIFSFMLDGRHLCKFLAVLFFALAFLPNWILSISVWLCFWIVTEIVYKWRLR